MDKAGARRLAQAVRAGDRRALARAATMVENRWHGWLALLEALQSPQRRAKVVGITGSAGSGKSTLVSAVTTSLEAEGEQVAIIAVDPSSPLSGGAVLGDRVRMHALSSGSTFIRSLSTRGAMGGVCRAARDMVDLFDAAGFGMVLVETVGVGQDEVDVMSLADEVLLVCNPGQGDGIQAIKAGVMEIADLFVVNKADQAGAARLVSQLHQMLATRADPARRGRPIFTTAALTGQGVAALADRLRLRAGIRRRQDQPAAERVAEVLRLLQPELLRMLQQCPQLASQSSPALVRQLLGAALPSSDR